MPSGCLDRERRSRLTGATRQPQGCQKVPDLCHGLIVLAALRLPLRVASLRGLGPLLRVASLRGLGPLLRWSYLLAFLSAASLMTSSATLAGHGA